MKRRITKARVRFISLCPKGMNQFPVLYKSEDLMVTFDALVKAAPDFDEKGLLTAVVFAPEIRDKEGDVASAAVIEEMAHDYLKNGKGIDLRHNGVSLTKEQAAVVENFIIQKGDPRFLDFKTYDGTRVDVTGGWGLVVEIKDPVLRKSYRSGAWNGVSLEGPAVLELEKHDEEEIDMKPEEIAKLIKEQIEAALKPVTETIEGLKKSAEPKKPEPKQIDVTDIKALRARAAELRKAEILAKLDVNDPAAIEAYLAEADKTAPGGKTIQKGDEDPEVARLKQRIAFLEKGSKAPEVETLSKEQLEKKEALATAKAMAAYANR